MSNILFEEGLSFDDVLLVPDYSAILPDEVTTRVRLTKELELNVPIVSAAMDTVTEALTAISMARAGGLGFIHRNLSIEEQAIEVDRVKKSESGMIVDPITIRPDTLISEVLQIMSKYRISGVPVTEGDKLVGIVTNRDLRFETQLDKPARDVMTSENLVTVPEKCTLDESKIMLHKHRIEKLLVVNKEGKLKGLITIKDIEKIKKYPNACKDSLGRLRAGAAIGVGSDMMERVQSLMRASADALVIDTSHGHSKNVMDAIRKIKAAFPACQLVAGNVATELGAKALIDAGADAVKIGIGPGSICTTRIVAGVGVPQLTAIQNCAQISKKTGVPIIADGGIKFSGDIAKALGAGASSVMLGSLLAGTHESPGEIVIYQGRTYKAYRGMGSVEAMKQGSSDRYYQKDTAEDEELVPEGIVGRIPYRGTVRENIVQMIGGLKAGMGYLGAATIEELHNKARFIKISSAGLKESHVHDVVITKEAPNYRVGSN
ncbi:MAG: IMP dehydrogenase [Desulfobacteraceae bacterium]|nr:IMP dehydrogenase [Desulfobacteraceae bacterium]